MASQCCVMRCEYISYQTSVCDLTLQVCNAQHTALAVRRHSGSSWHASVGKPYRTGFSAVMRKRPPERERERDCLQSLSSAKEAFGIVYRPI